MREQMVLVSFVPACYYVHEKVLLIDGRLLKLLVYKRPPGWGTNGGRFYVCFYALYLLFREDLLGEHSDLGSENKHGKDKSCQ